MSQRYSLSALAKRSEIPARTIRFYIARGLLSGPKLAGRGATYDEVHLERIKEIRAQQERGLTLAEIAVAVAKDDDTSTMPLPSATLRYVLGEDAEVFVRADLSPWRLNRIRKAIGMLNRLLNEENDNEKL